MNGGYFPDSWGWPTLVSLILAAGAAVVGERLVLRRLDVILLGALAAFTAWTALSALWAPSAGLAVEGAQLDLLYLTAAAAFLVVAAQAPAVAGGRRAVRGGRRRGVLARRAALPGLVRLVRSDRRRLPARRPDRLLERARAAHGDGGDHRARARRHERVARAPSRIGCGARAAAADALLHVRARCRGSARARTVGHRRTRPSPPAVLRRADRDAAVAARRRLACVALRAADGGRIPALRGGARRPPARARAHRSRAAAGGRRRGARPPRSRLRAAAPCLPRPACGRSRARARARARAHRQSGAVRRPRHRFVHVRPGNDRRTPREPLHATRERQPERLLADRLARGARPPGARRRSERVPPATGCATARTRTER